MSFEKLRQNCSLSSEKDIYAKQAICNNKANYMHMFYPQVVFISKDWHRFGTETDRGTYHVTGVWNETSTACRFGVRYTKLLKSFQRKNSLVTVYMSLVAASKFLYKSNVCFPYSIYCTFSRRFYPKRLTIAFRLYIFNQYVCSLGIEPTTFCATDAMLYHWATQEQYNETFLPQGLNWIVKHWMRWIAFI